MDSKNSTEINEFIIVGFSVITELQLPLFLTFLVMYIITVLGNVSIILTYIFTPSLNSPMYFCLSNFSFLEICYVSSTAPTLLPNLLAGRKTISFYGCALQMYYVMLFGGTECYLLAALAYDRYNAICHPLRYNSIMAKQVCTDLICGSWLIGAVNSLIHTILTFNLDFCNKHEIDHFFCDVTPMLELSCTDTWNNKIVIFAVGGGVVIGSLSLTVLSYVSIISTILNIRSGRKKAFSTCSSHFIVVAIFYGSAIFMYFRSKSMYSIHQEGMTSLMYTIIAPLLNPFIYTLRNNEFKLAIRQLVYRMVVQREYV